MSERGARVGWRAAFWPIALLTLLCAAFFWDVLWLPPGRMITGNDLDHMFLPWLRFARSSIQHGTLPLWNPYTFSGLPFAANPQPAVFYPPTWLALLVPVETALNLILVLHIWLAGVGAYVWLRFEGASRSGGFLGAIIYCFSGYFSVRIFAGHLGVVTTQAWLPFLLWGLGRAVRKRSWKLSVAAGLPVALSVLAGHTASFVLVGLAVICYALFLAWERWRESGSVVPAGKVLLQGAVMVAIGAALAAVQLLPAVELVLDSARQASSGYEFASRFSWPPGYLITLLVPNFFGEPVRTGYWGDGIYDEFVLYVGVLPLLLALLGLRLRHRLIPFLAALGLGGLLVSFGGYASAHRVLHRFLPIFQWMRAPARAGFLFVIAAAGMAAFAAAALGAGDEAERKRLLRPLTWTKVGLTIAVATTVVVAGFGAFGLLREDNPAAARLYHLANSTALFAFFLLLASSFVLAWRPSSRNGAAYWTLAVGLVVVDLWTFGGGLLHPVEIEPSAYWQVVAEVVGEQDQARVLPWGLNDFFQNGGMEYGLRSVFGYDPLILQRYEEFITSWPDTRARTYDLLNAGYLVAGGPLDFAGEEWPEAPRLLAERDGVYVYERPGALPRAWVATEVLVQDGASILATIRDPVFDPLTTALVEQQVACELPSGSEADASSAEVVRYEPSGVEVLVNSGGGLLIVSEVYYPGWRATIDGASAELVRTDYVLRGLCVPAGEHTVELVYDPPLLKVGLAITAITAVLLTGLGLWWVVVSLRRGRA
jgi:hypothetical protein